VRCEDQSGRVGFGEAAPIASFGTGTVDDAEAELARLGDPMAPGAWRALPHLGGPARFALATAEAALALGGGPAAPVRDYWPVAGLLPAGRPALAAVSAQLEAGFRTFKWKVGVGDPADEWGLLDDLLGQLPNGAKLRLDANGAWDRRRAERWLERCAERPIEFVEQPIAADSRGATDVLLGLAGDYPTPLALDESLVTTGDLHRWVDLGWPGVWVVKLALLGDPIETLATLQAAKADVVFSSALETGLGAAATLKAAFSWPDPVRALGYGVWPLFADPSFDGPARAPFMRAADVGYDAGAMWENISRATGQ
jgi:O-succinylbenzoate synthase